MTDIQGISGSMEQAPASDAGAFESRRHLLKSASSSITFYAVANDGA